MLALVLAILSVGAAIRAPAAHGAGDVGYEGISFEGTGGGPSGQKPESKLWFNDGAWWGSLWDRTRGGFFIHRLDAPAQSWTNTGVALDPRANSSADTLWDGAHLYVASHLFSTLSASGFQSRLYRYSYDSAADRYSLDQGFPVAINNQKTETLVIDKDSTGRLWATWRQGNTIFVSHSTSDDRTWASPFPLPVSGATTTDDDIASLVAFGGDKLGLMWSNQAESAMYFAVHADGDPPGEWRREVAVAGPDMADDHVNLKADRAGRVYAATKTSQARTLEPLTLLLVREPGGEWASHTYGLVADRHTRPIVLIDEANGLVRLYATATESGGTIYEKTAPLGAIAFPSGRGTPFIQDADSANVNDPGGTKQIVGAASGLVVLAGNNQTRRYWHNALSLGQSAPQADFEATPRTGTAPLTVSFTDRSTGAPVSWQWDFGDGSLPSSEPNPTHTYTDGRAYSVTLTVTDAHGATSTRTKSDYIAVGRRVSLSPTADAYVNSSSTLRNYGSDVTLRARQGTTSNPITYVSYLRFAVPHVSAPVRSATLRLFVDSSSRHGGVLYPAGDVWSESAITWANAPAATGGAVAVLGRVTAGGWVEVALPASLFATGTESYSFQLRSEDSGAASAVYSSREGANPAQLVLETG